jgi:hypothetical protein
VELENLFDDGKGKGTSGSPVRPKVPRQRTGADCLVVVKKWGNAHGAKGTTQAGRSLGQPAMGGTEAINRRIAAASLRRAGRRESVRRGTRG